MPQENDVYIVALIIAGGINGLLAIHTYLHRNKSGKTCFALFILTTVVYSFGYAAEIAHSTLPAMLFWLKVEYIGIAPLPALWIIVAVQYVGRSRWLTRSVLAALFFIPVVTLLLHFTNNYHHLFYRTVSISTNGPFPLISLTKGPWYWVHIAYINLSLLFGNILYLKMWFSSTPPYRRQIALILLGSLAPWVSFLIYLAGKSPWGLDLSPFGFAFIGPFFALGLFRYSLFNLAPIARDIVFEGMSDGVLVLDEQNRIMDFNASAQKIVQSLSINSIGHDAETILQDYPALLKQLSSNTYEQIESKIAQGEESHYYNFRFSPIMNRRNILIGKTVVINNITEQVLLLSKLRMLATTDYLTNIYNRSHFMDMSLNEISRAKQLGHPVAVILIDIDHFKQVNDTYGHKAGDIAIKAVVDACRSVLCAKDIFGRYGGEEFAVLLPETAYDVALESAERMRKKIAETVISVDSAKLFITASFGVVGTDNAMNVGLDELLKSADMAMYRAKAAGRNCVMLSCD